jgi:hypothetical protein
MGDASAEYEYTPIAILAKTKIQLHVDPPIHDSVNIPLKNPSSTSTSHMLLSLHTISSSTLKQQS